jgi:Outer membrane efflux protein
LLERRPDIAAAERLMAASNEQIGIGIAQAAYYPTLNLAAQAGLEGSSLLNWFNWPSRFWAVGPSMSETIFDGGRRRATTELARAGYDASVATYAPGPKITKEEIEQVGYEYADATEMRRRYDPAVMKEGWNIMLDGEEVFYISTPSAGLWTTDAKLNNPARRELVEG